jgi:hypothetical protein
LSQEWRRACPHGFEPADQTVGCPWLRVSPAMAAGVTNRLFDVSDLVALLIESESTKAA